MLSFDAQVYQNEYLPDGAGEVNAYLPFLETGWRLLSASGLARRP